MGNSCGCVGGGDSGGGRRGKGSYHGIGDRDLLRAKSVIAGSRLDGKIECEGNCVRSPGEVRDQTRFARPFIKGTCPLDKHEGGGGTGGGGGSNFNNVQ